MDTKLEYAIRSAVATGDFILGRRLWEEYAFQCRNEIRHGSDPRGTLAKAHHLLVWCRQMALAARTQAQVQLDRLARRSRVAAAYSRPEAPPPGSIRAARF